MSPLWLSFQEELKEERALIKKKKNSFFAPIGIIFSERNSLSFNANQVLNSDVANGVSVASVSRPQCLHLELLFKRTSKKSCLENRLFS